MAGKIVVRGARVHNLKNIDVEIPRDRLVVITGVSGSGKSSLAFDTLYAEGQRRYLESLGADARQFLTQMKQPDVDAIEGLSPAIAIQQTVGFANPRSTVGTLTEVYDHLRLLFARLGQPTCHLCGREISAQTIDQISDQLRLLPDETRLLVMAPVKFGPEVEAEEVLQDLARAGFARVKIHGQIYELPEADRIAAGAALDEIDLIVDRLVLRPGVDRRLADSLEVASRLGREVIKVEVVPPQGSEATEALIFTQKFACIPCGISLPEITPRLFSFNSPEGACPACKGLGMEAKPRPRGTGRDDDLDADPCRKCKGARLNPQALAVKLGDKTIADLTSMSVSGTRKFLQELKVSEQARVIGRKLLGEIGDRLQFLIQLGLDYLTLDRSAVTLSGGEAQRVRLANQLGSSLAGVLYVLDEPSVGLHQKDNAQLLTLLKQLRDVGNSVIVVEHDPEAMLAADHIIDIGPGAGVKGGEIVAQGTAQEIMAHRQSLTGQYLSGSIEMPVSEKRRTLDEWLVITGAKENNLKNLTVEIPVGAITCVTGVSGSGKSSLVMNILYKAVAKRLSGSVDKAGKFDELIGAEHFDRVIGIDQAPIGRTPRSNPATYTGLFDHMRTLFAQLPEARVRGYRSERFSFNAPGGRCEACSGEGVVRVDMHFLPPLYVACEHCKGRRYNRETLEIKYKGLNIADVLDLPVQQASEMFGNVPGIFERLRALREVGLGYLRLGQSAQTLSGGEAQRVKLARELARKSAGRSLYVLDEPTTGLHFDDVRQLMELLHRLKDAGNTVVIIEHNLDVIRSADHIIDLGPGGGDAGGRLVASGTPEDIASTSGSFTGQYIAKSRCNGYRPDRAKPDDLPLAKS